MGILRADRVSGLGGANAIDGSVFFGRNGTTAAASGNWLTAYSESDFSFGTGDFTIEYWFYFTGVTGSNSGSFQISNTPGGINNANGASTGGLALDYENNCVKGIGNNGWFNGTNTVAVGTWNHVALVRYSGTLQIFTNGVADTSASDSQNYSLTHLAIGGYYSTSHLFQGYISNFRIVKGTAVYSAAFTPPTERLTAIDGTVLLACQSPGNILQEATGKTLDIRKVTVNDAPPMASRFAPDKGEDHGTTFEDNTKFDTLSYMVPPGGRTDQRSRGRGCFGGGYTSSPSGAAVKRIYYVQIQSMGTSAEFGDTYKAAAWGQGGCSSSTRGLFTGGTTPTNLQEIDYITIATTSNALDFGDLSIGHGYTASCSNNTRGLTGGGRGGSPTARLAQIDYNTIATLGNGQDFGDLTQSRMGLGAVASSTRAVFTGGNGSPADPSTVYNNIDYVEFATTGNATDFGDMTDEHTYHGSCSSSTRGIIYGGDTSYGPTVITDIIEYVTTSSTGSGTDFGDVRDDGPHAHGTSNSIKGVFAGGTSPYRNSIDFITIATTGNGQEWGDLPITSGSYAYAAGLSDSHGGIS